MVRKRTNPNPPLAPTNISPAESREVVVVTETKAQEAQPEEREGDNCDMPVAVSPQAPPPWIAALAEWKRMNSTALLKMEDRLRKEQQSDTQKILKALQVLKVETVSQTQYLHTAIRGRSQQGTPTTTELKKTIEAANQLVKKLP